MRSVRVRCALAGLVGAIGALFGDFDVGDAEAQNNSWINTGAGKWETNSNWSLNAAPTNTHSGTFITNAFSKTVTIDSITSSNFPGTLTISNLTVSAPSSPLSFNTLFLNNSGLGTPLRILNFLKIDSNATLLLYSNSVVQVDNPTFTGFVNIDGGGFVNLVDGGTLAATNQTTSLGLLTTGDIVVNNGILRTLNLSMGNFPGAVGTLRLQAGFVEVKSDWSLGASGGSTAAVWVTGGQLVATNGFTTIGNASSGRLTVSNGTVNAGTVTVAQTPGTAGTLTVAGGTFTADRLVATSSSAIIQFTSGNMTLRGAEVANGSPFIMGAVNRTAVLNLPAGTNRFGLGFVLGPAGGASTTDMVWITGGHLIVTNGTTTIGDSAIGQITVSNGSCRARDVNLGRDIFSRGMLAVAGGTSSISSNLNVGDGINSTGEVWITGGQLAATNAPTIVGGRGSGLITISNGVFLANAVRLATNVTGRGTLTVAGGATTVSGPLFVGFAAGATAAVWLTGGELIATNSSLGVGVNGIGLMTVSNGTCRALNVAVGDSPASGGTLTFTGGTNVISGDLYLGINLGSTGTVWMSGGQLSAANFTYIGYGSVGRMTVSNGAHQARAMIVGNAPGAQGTFTVAGGVSRVDSNLTLGNFACTATGTVIVAGGSLFITNSVTNAVLEVRSGTFTMSGGILTADRLVVTNACAHFVRNGGTAKIRTLVLPQNQSTVGDGIADVWRAVYFGGDGTTSNSASCATCDPDGDGQNNLAEFTMGTYPNDANSRFRITSIVRTNNDVRITWTVAPTSGNGLSLDYLVQFGTNLLAGVTNNLSPFIVVGPGFSGTTTNYVDVGGATNRPVRFYRINGFID